ncbi:MAG: E3 binding domain-containing protein, partial [Ktedonobacteraceae bacterium]|nr:E3 binding domain-containing protein [Ktedonobacteraceae bacterium]
MPTPVKMPRLGESVAEGTVGSWLKQEGDYVEKDESLAEIVTDKINAELPSPIAGRLAKILVNADETVAVGTDIALIEESADVSSSPPAHAAPGPDAAPVESTAQATTPVLEEKTAATAVHNKTRESENRRSSTAHGEEEERQRISPLAKRLAREHGIDLNTIEGTGTGGRVRKEDILAYIAQRQSSPSTVQATPASTQLPSLPTAPVPVAPRAAYAAPVPITFSGTDEEVTTPSRMRLAIAEHMVRSKRTSPHATTVVEVDMTNIAKW